MDDPNSKKGARENRGKAGPQGVGVPAKGDSASNVPLDDGATISESLAGLTSTTANRISNLYVETTLLQPGDLIGERYEILALLGEGGMGAVYKALDKEVERTVALKLIRPELASNPAILARFKQELLTASRVTHKNVIRIYDIGEADGVKFITMEFVEGDDLRRILVDNGKLPPDRAVEIIRQVCLALDAAHSAGIIHRDLKPQNIMQDSKTGRILVMDFGLARSIESGGMTQTGALLGTIEYMSPEQSMGKALDQRSDIFAVGLIFYELLTGNTPYKADSAMASLLRRNQERAVPAADLDPTIPKGLSDIVSKCLERDVSLRYQNVGEIQADLDAWQGKMPVSASMVTAAPSVISVGRRQIPWKWIASGALALLLVGLGGWMYRGRGKPASETRPTAGPEVSLAILPFHNSSTDTSLDWIGTSLSDMLSTDVGQSARLRTVSSDRLHQILKDLRVPANADFDPNTLRHMAEFSNADVLVYGHYAKFGDQIRIDATLEDHKRDRHTPLTVNAATEKDLPGAVDQLAELIRQNLAMSSDVLKELKASSFQPTSKSVSALRDYNQGLQLLRDGKSLEAQKQFAAATTADPKFALAFSKLAQTYSSLGYDSDAEQSAKKAVELSEGLPEAEKYLISAIRYQVTKDYPEAIKAYENLAKASPGNSDVQSTLASLYEEAGDFAKASQYNQKILAANPNDISATLAMGRLAINSGKPQEALDPLNRALTLSVQMDNQEEKANALHSMGNTYRMLNKPEEALRNCQEALAIQRQLGQKRGIAQSLNEMARTQTLLGKNKEALANFQEALQIRRDIGDKHGLGDTLIDMGNLLDDGGDHDQALKMYKEALEVQRDLGNETLQASCLNNIGSVYFEKAQYEDARTYFEQALQFYEKSKSSRDIADARHNLAETSVRTGQPDKAVSQYMLALEAWRSVDDTRDAAIESYALGKVFDSQGRFGAAINSKQEALKTFTGLKDKTYWMAEIQSGYGESLILAGRAEEAKTYLNDALSLARELKNDGLVAQTLGFQGDGAYYRGDAKSAGILYEQALQSATHSKEPDRILLPKINIAKVAIQDGNGQQAITSLGSLRQRAEELGLKQMSVECSVYMAEAMAQKHDNAHAQQELERALAWTDKVGLKPLSAKAHYLLATILRSSGHQGEAQQHYREALQLFDDMRKDPGGDKILQRSDFKTMYEEAARWSQAAKN